MYIEICNKWAASAEQKRLIDIFFIGREAHIGDFVVFNGCYFCTYV